ncbi:MAG: hexokinase [Spirochaetaceae bacterium]|jgi:hexokinase|nr:hexokinase [Spirochaetaceae bacterium]
MSVKEKVYNYLKKENLFFQSIDLDDYVREFHGEMNKGLSGENSSMAMIPTYVKGHPHIPRNIKTIVLDAGGTNLRAALVSFDDNGAPVVENFKKIRMPGFDREVSKEEFYEILVDHFADFADQADSIGFCFSYPAEITPDRDAIPTLFTKEIKAREVLGESIQENISAMLKKKGLKSDHRLVVLNDTVATQLTGMSSTPDREYDGYIGYILGTGINGCYQEDSSNIGKIQSHSSDSQIINTECGSFSHFPRGKVDEAFDSSTVCPGQYHLEKACSGGYFGPLCELAIKEAAEKGLFSADASKILKGLKGLNTMHADNYMHNPQDQSNMLVELMKPASSEDKEVLFWLLDSLLERAAKLTAGSLAALVLKGQCGENVLKPVCLTVDGTTFYAYYKFKARVERYLDEYLVKKHGRYYEIIQVEDAPLLGAAIAALTNR